MKWLKLMILAQLLIFIEVKQIINQQSILLIVSLLVSLRSSITI